ncbi:hypothetical protein KDL01_10815 [Actinospica durhamensis]|uniref:Uncharacterized protein n=1 Tax=Actinospica durhamensis TaxID=1508375 RepID=A0A941INA6_9ACTN|nr:hypothetical protein [Actinospica durhamensis]MBR7833759.1 hypothetical protein [Actinospica durhamensis]
MRPTPTRSHRALGLLAVLAAVLLGLTLAGPANAAAQASATHSAAAAAQTAPTVVTWTDGSGRVFHAQALTAAQIKADGLTKYVDVNNLAVTTPRIATTATGQAVAVGSTTAVKRPAGTISPAASGCWSTWFGYGTFSGLQLWGKTDVTWCGGGTWVTYATSNCYGYQNYPTYQYLGCNNYPNYGVGWNLYQVKTQYLLCYAWVPVWGSCVAEDFPWEQYQFLGSGVIDYNGGGS